MSDDSKGIIDESFKTNVVNSLRRFIVEKSLSLSSLKEEKNTVLLLLNLFNCIKLDGDTILPQSEACLDFLKSLILYIEHNFSIISHWEELGAKENTHAKDVLNNGAQLLYELETRRSAFLRDKSPTDIRNVVIILVKAELEDSDVPRYLFQYSFKSHKYQSIGGYADPKDTDLNTSVSHILQRELPLNEIVVKAINKFDKHQTFKVSNRTGLYTQYDVDIYHAVIETPHILKLTGRDRWFSIEEMKQDFSHDGKKIMSILNTEKSKIDEFCEKLNALELSLAKKQPFQKEIAKEIEEENIDVLRNLLKHEESEALEFKSSIRWDYVQNNVNKGLEKVIIKTIGAFMNSKGGKLIIGVDDHKNILGLEQDISTLKKKDEDGLMLHLMGLIDSYIGVEFNSFIDISFFQDNSKTVCVVDIQKAPEPVFIRDGESREFYMRNGNRSKQLNSEEVYRYISIHWQY